MHPAAKFNNMKKIFYLTLLLFAFAGFKLGTTITISGTVYDAASKETRPGVSVQEEGTKNAVITDISGKYSIRVKNLDAVLTAHFVGYQTSKIKIKGPYKQDIWLRASTNSMHEVVVRGYQKRNREVVTGSTFIVSGKEVADVPAASITIRISSKEESKDSYKEISENKFINPATTPLSTFAVDVDGASYSNMRRFINSGQLPPADAVRIEEMINYFKYDLNEPGNSDPVAITTELSTAPWNEKHHLLRIGLRAKQVETEKLPPSNLVFLIDVSGSMAPGNRLPLVKASLKMLVDQLREKDNVAIVTYAGEAGLKLPSTKGNLKTKIKNAIDELQAGGSTAGGGGLMMAYQVARENFIKNGNNRITMATDGDFNVGMSSDKEMEKLIAREREDGISISVLGFGMGNYKDSKLEIIADKGHGNYAYIDNADEARKAMVSEFGGTLFTVAKDVKIQIEFNPAKVQAYRLLGYENRLLEKEDFNNDKKLGGDMGVGHTVTALYELIPTGVKSDFAATVDPLKYQKQENVESVVGSAEIATIKFRYKDPQSNKSLLKQTTLAGSPVVSAKASDDFRFASAVAEFGLLLRNSEFKQKANFNKLIARAKTAKGKDEEGYRAEFIRLAESAELLVKSTDLAQESEE